MNVDVLFVIAIVALLTYAIVFGLAGYGWLCIKTIKLQSTFEEKVTIIIPARNEELSINNCLNSILQQTHLNYEVIVVNDHSIDDTEFIVSEMIDLHPHKLQLINLNETYGKKSAIKKAIEKSKGELIVTTDADCVVGSNWIKTLHSTYLTSKSRMVVGPVSMMKQAGLLSAFQNIEQMGLTIVSAGGVFYKKPILCSGANLLYEKAAFDQIKGFDGIDDTPTGDDVLLMQKLEKKFGGGAISFSKHKDAIVKTKPLDDMGKVIHQKVRWSSKIKTNHHYFTFFLSVIIAFSNLLVVAYTLFTVVKPQLVEKLLLLFAFKAVIDILFLSLATSFFGKTKLLLLALPLQVVVPFYTVFIGAASMLGNYKWKGRSYHNGKER